MKLFTDSCHRGPDLILIGAFLRELEQVTIEDLALRSQIHEILLVSSLALILSQFFVHLTSQFLTLTRVINEVLALADAQLANEGVVKLKLAILPLKLNHV